jgi:hypothetical protein
MKNLKQGHQEKPKLPLIAGSKVASHLYVPKSQYIIWGASIR